MNRPVPQTAEDVRELLAGLHAKRGYLLPHHGLLAVAEPALLDAYDATYTAMTLNERALVLRDKEIIWLIILVATNEAIATHHIDRLRKGGGSDADLETAVALAAWAQGAQQFVFVDHHWGAHLPDFDPVAAYRRGVDALVGDQAIDPAVIEMGLAAAHQCHRRWDWVKEHIRGAYRHGADERALAEALSLAMFPGGVPNFVDACGHWRDLIVAGEVEASGPFRAWAELSGQGGFDEAAGIAQAPSKNADPQTRS